MKKSDVKIIVVTGKSGSGKQERINVLVKEFQLKQLSTGDIFREYLGNRYLSCGAGSEMELPHPGIRNFELESPSVK